MAFVISSHPRNSMNWLTNQVQGLKSPDTILHLGAGTCRELDAYQSLAPRQIILVEPNPELVEILQSKANSAQNIHIRESAVSSQASDNCLQIMSDPNFSSLREPVGLLELFPGLRVERQLNVDLLDINGLVEALELNASLSHMLFIDTPGVEAELLNAMIRSGAIESFCDIFIRTGTDTFYAGELSAQDLSADLDRLGYKTMGQPDQSDPDFPVTHLHLDRQFVENQKLVAELEEAQQNFEKTQNQLQEQNALLADKDQHIESLNQRNQEQGALLADKDQQIESLNQRDQEQGALLANATQARDESIAEIKALEKVNQELQFRQSMLDGEIVKAEAQLELIKDVVLRDKAF
ncbi:MAG: hypothetical protein ABJN62_13145 [Halioglobus sp.]